MDAELTPQARAARAVHLLMTCGPMTAGELTERLGYAGRFSVYDLLDNLAIGVPLYFDEALGRYGILPPVDGADT